MNLPRHNLLASESSPYLSQHAENPVAWQPWCEDAFETARTCNVPVFLSIGYSTCHWCHVMAHESFENPQIAQLLNENFVCIKVDREERPDIDAVYMRFCQALTGSGGWPLTIVMTPDKKPFFAATYIPPTTRGNRPGMIELVPRIADAWNERRDDILKSAQDIVNAVNPPQPARTGRTRTQRCLPKPLTDCVNPSTRSTADSAMLPNFPRRTRCFFCCASGNAPAPMVRFPWQRPP